MKGLIVEFWRAVQDRVEVLLLKGLWTFVFVCALTYNLYVKITGYNPGSAPTVEPQDAALLSSWLQTKYNYTAYFYDFCDMPWERIYRTLRPLFVGNLVGECLELAVGTGRNIRFYNKDATLTGIDISSGMIRQARARSTLPDVSCTIKAMIVADATNLEEFPDNTFDNVSASFLFCVLPTELQQPALNEIQRVLKPGGRFRIIELTYSNDPKKRWYQDTFAPFVEFMYGAKFDRHTLTAIEKMKGLKVERKEFLNNGDVMLLLEGSKRA
jgi:ubiquinone/menaquinone biosynthesis C-methylase UbiE